MKEFHADTLTASVEIVYTEVRATLVDKDLNWDYSYSRKFRDCNRAQFFYWDLVHALEAAPEESDSSYEDVIHDAFRPEYQGEENETA
jgi:hypothetical protein